LKVKEYWFNEPLKYRYGVVINLNDSKNYKFCICNHSNQYEFKYQQNFNRIKKVKIFNKLNKITNEIRKITDDSHDKSKVDDMIKQIDKLVYHHYELSEEETKMVEGEGLCV